MSMITLVASSFRTVSGAGSSLTDSAALVLLLAGGISLAIAGYLLTKPPKIEAVRMLRRR